MRLDHVINEKFEPVSEFISNIIFYSVQYGEAQIKLIVLWLFLAALFSIFNLNIKENNYHYYKIYIHRRGSIYYDMDLAKNVSSRRFTARLFT